MKQNRTKSTEELMKEDLEKALREREEADRQHEEAVREHQIREHERAKKIRDMSIKLQEIEAKRQEQDKQDYETKKKDKRIFKKIRRMSLSNVENEGLSYVEFADPEVCEYADMDGVLETRYTDQFIETEQIFRYRASEDKQIDKKSKGKSSETKRVYRREKIYSYETVEDSATEDECRLNPFPLDKSNNLIYGPPQSGKTKRIQTLSFIHMLFNKCSAVVILRNSKDDANQLKSRCKQFAEEHKAFIRSKFPTRHVKSLEYAYVGTSSVQKLRESVSRGRMIIAIANQFQMSRLEEVLVEGTRYITMIDEADLVAGAYSEEYSGAFRKTLHKAVLKNSGKTYSVTATTFDLIFSSDEIKASKTFEMKINQNYCGLEKIKLCRVGKFDDDDLQPTGKSESCFTHDKYLRPLLEYLSKRNEYFQLPTEYMYSQVVSDGHPMVLLIKNTRFLEKQRQLLNEIVEIENWTEGIVYNGEGLVIQSKYLSEITKIANTLTKPYKVKCGVNIGEVIVTGDRENQNEAEEKGGKRCLYIKENISFGMQCFRELIKTGVKITHLVIIADRMADRGISFVSSDYNLRLTCQYYVPSSTATISHKIQAIRLCGVYSDNLPSMLFAPPDVCEDLVKANLGQKELIGRLKSSGSEDGAMTVCSGLKYSNMKVPGCKWGNVNMPCQIVQGNDGGASRKEYRQALGEIKNAEGVEHLMREEDEEEEKRDPTYRPNVKINDYWYIPSPSAGNNLKIYQTIVTHLKKLKNTWVELTQLRRLFSDDKFNIYLHDGVKQEGYKGLLWRQPGGKGTVIEYCWRD